MGGDTDGVIRWSWRELRGYVDPRSVDRTRLVRTFVLSGTKTITLVRRTYRVEGSS